MGVDVERVLSGVVARFAQGVGDAPRLGGAVGARGCRMVGVAGVAVAHHFAVDFRSARERVLQFLENQHRGSVAHHESLAVGAEGQRGVVRVLGAGKGLGVGEAGDSERGGHVLAASGDHGVGIAVAYRPEGLAERIGGGGAGGHHVDAGAFGAEAYGDLAGGHVGYDRGHHQG